MQERPDKNTSNVSVDSKISARNSSTYRKLTGRLGCAPEASVFIFMARGKSEKVKLTRPRPRPRALRNNSYPPVLIMRLLPRSYRLIAVSQLPHLRHSLHEIVWTACLCCCYLVYSASCGRLQKWKKVVRWNDTGWSWNNKGVRWYSHSSKLPGGDMKTELQVEEIITIDVTLFPYQ